MQDTESVFTPPKPWQVRISYCEEFGHLVIAQVLHHTHPSVVFSHSAAEYCGGATEKDDDDYITGVLNDEYSIIGAARLISGANPEGDRGEN